MFRVWVCLAVFALWAVPGWATVMAPPPPTPITYSGYTVLNNQTVTVTDAALGIEGESGGAGEVTLEQMSFGGSLQSWCVDIADELLTSGGFTGLTVMTGALATEINALISNAGPQLGSDSDASAALQVAIWEEDYGSGLTVSAPARVAALASTYQADVANGTWRADGGMAVAELTGGGRNQSQVFLVAVPEPASGVLLLAALAGFAWRWRRRAVAARDRVASQLGEGRAR